MAQKLRISKEYTEAWSVSPTFFKKELFGFDRLNIEICFEKSFCFLCGIETVLNFKFPIAKPQMSQIFSKENWNLRLLLHFPPYDLFPDTDIEQKNMNLRIY